MFIIERVRAEAEIREQSEIDIIVAELDSGGYRPLLRSMVGAAKTAATLGMFDLRVDALSSSRLRLTPQTRKLLIGDLLFSRAGQISDRCYFVQPTASSLQVFEVRHHSVPTGLSQICGAIEQAARKRLDGRRVRGMNFIWQPRLIRQRSAQRVGSSSRFRDTDLKAKKAEYSEDELRAARLLVGIEARNLILQLAQIGKVRAADAKLPPALIEQLQNEHLLSKEYLVVCRKDSHTLCQVASVEDLNEVSGGKLVCATCGRKFSDELFHEIFAGTETGKQLVTSSRWMTIWLTDLLVLAGIARGAILWGATAGEDEIDIMTDALGLRIFFELKDREFGLGDAYSFAYRLDRYDGSLGVVVSTDRIAGEAEKFFQEQRSKSAASIETLAGTGIEAGIRERIDKYSRYGIGQVLADYSDHIGINIAAVVSGWMDMFSGMLRSGRYKPPVPPPITAEAVTTDAVAAGGQE
jgi:hypothetical protein